MWYELWDVTLDMLLDEGDDPTLILETLQIASTDLEQDDVLELMLIERHPALNAESVFTGADVLPHLEKRVATWEQRQKG